MSVKITSGSIQFLSGSGEQTTFKQSELVNLKAGKAISASGEFRGDRIMGTSDATTFIDFGGAKKKLHHKFGANVGSITFASRGRDVFQIHKNFFDFGDESLPANISVSHMDSTFGLSGSFEYTGSKLTIDGPGTKIDTGFIGANALANDSDICIDMTVPAGFNAVLYTTPTNPSITICEGVEYTISEGADVTVTSVLESVTENTDTIFTGGNVDTITSTGQVVAEGGIGNTSVINTSDITIPANTNVVLYTTPTNPSITIDEGVQYTVLGGADVTVTSVLESVTENTDTIFTGGNVDTITSTGLIISEGGGIGNTSVITTDVIIPINTNMVLYVDQYNDSITINDGIQYTVSANSNVTVKTP